MSAFTLADLARIVESRAAASAEKSYTKSLLEEGMQRFLRDADFQAELGRELKDWVGRPTALSPAPTLSRRWGATVYLKREDLAHTGAHKINNALGQALLAKRLGARRIIAA